MADFRSSIFYFAFHLQHLIYLLIFPITLYDSCTCKSHLFAVIHKCLELIHFIVSLHVTLNLERSLLNLVSHVTICGKRPVITATLNGDVTGSGSVKNCASYNLD